MKQINVDREAVRELILFAENSEAVYCGNTYHKNIPGVPFTGAGMECSENCIKKHIIKGDYCDDGAVKALRRVFDFAAKVYCRIYADAGFTFPASVRQAAAVKYTEDHRGEWHEAAVYQYRETLLYRAGMIDASGEWFATADDETTDNEIHKAARAYRRISDALIKRAAEIQEAGGNHVFYRCVLQVVQREIERWMFTAVNARRSSGNAAGADMAAAIIRAAQNLSNRAV